MTKLKKHCTKATIIHMHAQTLLNNFREEVSKKLNLSEEEWYIISNDIEIIDVKKNESLLKIGQIPDSLYIIADGYFQLYHIVNNKEFTISFSSKYASINALEAFIDRTPSKLGIKAITDGILFKISHSDLYKSYESHHISDRMGRIMTDISLLEKFRIEHQRNTLSSKERYFNLIKEHPKLVSNLKQKQIASYIGITPESLCRIKKSNCNNK